MFHSWRISLLAYFVYSFYKCLFSTFPEQASSPGPCAGRVESQPLDLQGSPWPDWWLVSGLPQCSARQAGFIKSKHVRRARERKRQRASENGSPQPSVTSVALRHVTRATSCHFSCALSIRSTSLGPAHIQRERVTQELDCQGAGGTGSRFRRLPTPGGADGKGPACPCRRRK